MFFEAKRFIDTYSLTAFDADTVADALGDLRYTVETYGWYGSVPTDMSDPAVIVAY